MAGADRGDVLKQFFAPHRLPVHYGGTMTPETWGAERRP